MKLFLKVISNIVFAIQVMLLFLLCFQQKIELPPLLQSVGRLHPMLLHLPIGILIIAVLLWLFKRNFETNAFQLLFSFLLHLAALTASLTALMGFFLSKEGGYDDTILTWHKWAGLSVSFLSCILLLIWQYRPQKKMLFGFSIVVSFITLVVAGHFGSELTHGEGYVLQPMQGDKPEEQIIITDSTALFAAAISPILKSKCSSCHNDQKMKGELSMASIEKLLKGGKDGPLWVAGDAINSHIIQKINLPEEDKKHMPPSGKPQLNDAEKALLYAWIQSGADMRRSLKEYNVKDSLYLLASGFINQAKDTGESQIVYSFKAASQSTITALNSPFCIVAPLSINSPALEAEFFVREKFDIKKLEELQKVKEQMVSLNLSNMPIKDEDLKLISNFSNLEKLNLNNTAVTGKTLAELGKLKNLNSLSLAGTKVDKNIFSMLSLFPALKELFIWNTGITADDTIIQKQFKNIAFNYGYVPDKNEILKLNAPILKNEQFILTDTDKIVLSHPLPGTLIRYTTDGTMPDSVSSPVYKDPLAAQSYIFLKALAVKDGWYTSDVISYSFFKKGFRATSAELINDPEKTNMGKGASTIFNQTKGSTDNIGDTNWLGYREKPFAAYIFFEGAPAVSSITISYASISFFYIMPPVAVEIWAGEDKQHLKQLKKIYPPQLKQMEGTSNQGIYIPLPTASYKCYKIIANPIASLPPWHPGKGQKGWIFIDEIFFN